MQIWMVYIGRGQYQLPVPPLAIKNWFRVKGRRVSDLGIQLIPYSCTIKRSIPAFFHSSSVCRQQPDVHSRWTVPNDRVNQQEQNTQAFITLPCCTFACPMSLFRQTLFAHALSSQIEPGVEVCQGCKGAWVCSLCYSCRRGVSGWLKSSAGIQAARKVQWVQCRRRRTWCYERV